MSAQNSGRAFGNPNTIKQFAVASGGNAQRLPSVTGHTIYLKARCPGQRIYLGRFADGLANIPAADADGNKSIAMNDGDWFSFEVKNANTFAANATGAGCFLGIIALDYAGV